MRLRRLEETRIIELVVRPVRKFFVHPMATYAAALAYRGLFGLFPLLLILVVLVGALGFADSFDRAVDQARAQSSEHVPRQLEPVVERGRAQIQPLMGAIEQAQQRATGELLAFGIGVALWSVSAVARTLTEAFNVAYKVTESRRWWKVLLLSLAFGPFLAVLTVVALLLMLIGPQLVERVAEMVNLDELFVYLWGWLRFPVALFLLGAVLSILYRFGPNAEQRFRTVVPGAVLAVVAWAIVSVGFSVYLAEFANYGLNYGSLGAAVGLLVYLHLSASAVLLGTELNAAICHLASDRTVPTEKTGSAK